MSNAPAVALSLHDCRALSESWAVSLRAQGKTPETIRVYRRNLGQFLDYAERGQLAPMTRRTLDAFLADLLDRGREGTTARGRLTAVRQFARWLIREDELDADPFVGVTPPRLDTKVIEPLTDDEIRALLGTCVSLKGAAKDRRFRDVRDAALIRLMVETGLRASEVVGLALEDVHWRDDPPFLIVRTAKSRRGRTVPFSAHASMAVDRYARLRRHHTLHSSPSMWLGSRGNRLSYIGLYDSLTDRAERAGITRFHPHLLRHTAAHRWLAAGGSEGGLMSIAGWSRPDMLMRYTRARAEQRAAEEARRLNLGDL